MLVCYSVKYFILRRFPILGFLLFLNDYGIGHRIYFKFLVEEQHNGGYLKGFKTLLVKFLLILGVGSVRLLKNLLIGFMKLPCLHQKHPFYSIPQSTQRIIIHVEFSLEEIILTANHLRVNRYFSRTIKSIQYYQLRLIDLNTIFAFFGRL